MAAQGSGEDVCHLVVVFLVFSLGATLMKKTVLCETGVIGLRAGRTGWDQWPHPTVCKEWYLIILCGNSIVN